MPLTLKEFYRSYAEASREEWDKTHISVMVFGPNTNDKRLGSKLRKYIIDKCSEYGVVVRTEHKEFIDINRDFLGSNRNLCFAELKAAEHANAIIIIPDSPGSFVELGMFALIKNMHNKIMIIFKDDYNSTEAEKSFIYLGPKLSYDEGKAPIEYVNYRKKESVWQKVKLFLHEKKAQKYESDQIKKMVS